MMTITPNWIQRSLATMLVMLLVMTFVPLQALAQQQTPATTGTSSSKSSEVCTDFNKLKKDSEDSKKEGILTSISKLIKDVINKASKNLYEAFIKNSGYKAAVNAAITLMITIYAAAFLIGVVQPSFGDILRRLMKVAIIFALISPTGWEFFSQYAVKLFNDGTDQLIGGVIEIGTGEKFNAGDSPFKQLDTLSKWIISPDMIIAIIGTTTASGPYGLSMGLLLGWAIGGVIKLLIKALEVYALSFITRALLLGVAPIFIVFLLFDKTRGLFTGWLSALVNLSLQPILYFTFLSFFIVMLQGASKDMLGWGDSIAATTSSSSGSSTSEENKGIQFCWTEYAGAVGSTNKRSGWRIKGINEKAPNTDTFTWQGAASCLIGGDKTKCQEFPINIVDILTFLILVYVATRFSDVVDNLAADIANVAVNLSTHAKLDFMNEQKAKDSGGGGNTGAAGQGTSKTTTAPPPARTGPPGS